jgi:hypothetical protein
MKKVVSDIEAVAKTVEGTFVRTTSVVEQTVQKNLFKRFPITLVFAVSFGLVAVNYGAEQMFAQIPFFVAHPGILFMLGLFALMVTGKLYQKLG